MDIVNIFRGVFGILVLIGISYLLSNNKKAINWNLVFVGILLQLIFAVGVFYAPAITKVFELMSEGVVKFLEISEEGAIFLFGGLSNPNNQSFGYIFAFRVLPTIVFFSAFTSLMYYLGILQKVVKAFAWIMSKTMRLSGAESLAAAANIFIGQTEAPLVVKPYLENMTKSELLSLMVGGMATIAGGVLAAFIGFLGGDDPVAKVEFTKHLITASVISAPAALLVAKILIPETEEVNRNLDISKDKLGSNLFDALTRGTTDGVKLAVNVGAMLLVFTAIIAVINWVLGDVIGNQFGLSSPIPSYISGTYEKLSLQYIFGVLFSPIAFIIGTPTQDLMVMGQLLGEKTMINEFIAYGSLSNLKDSLHPKTVIIATYALCGFANFASIGIQVGGIGVLAPSKRSNLSKFGLKALVGGTIAALITASIAGMFFK